MNAVAPMTIQDASTAARAEIAAVREQIENCQVERDELQSGYLPSADVSRRIGDVIDREAQKIDAEYGIGALLRNDGKPADFSLLELSTRVGDLQHTIPDFAPLITFLFPELIKRGFASLLRH